MYLFRENDFIKNAIQSRGKRAFLPTVLFFIICVGLAETLSAMPASAWVFIAEYRGMSELVAKYMSSAITLTEYQEGLVALLNEASETAYFTLFLMLGAAVMAGVAFFYMLVIEKRPVRQMGVCPTKKQALLTPVWFLAGAVTAGGIVGIAYLSGAVNLTFTGLTFEGAIAFLAHAVRATGYTVLFCGALLPLLLSQSGSVLRSLLLTALFFAYQALLVPTGSILTFLNAFLLALLLCLVVIRTGNVWAGCAFCAAWDLTFGAVFGSVTAGGFKTPSLFTLTPIFGPYMDLTNGGEAGLTAGYVTSLVLLLLVVVVLYLCLQKVEKQAPHEEGGFFYS